MDELVPGGSLITDTPEEGRALAIEMATRTLLRLRPEAEPRVSGEVVAAEFATIAAANHYWRGPSWKRAYRPDRGDRYG
ncbi:hexameric tyrosine-coordinated heme protein [Actinocorallia sp. API 0066]|uniref:hexameric tyrosine-coordinated heme protein n=1 Tax=Actinocorallia sp. API 0066 TaxID=2896846 RepID=UPI001E3BF646|nr:hexameric tyrosine-coordinated heme protein [Actinocorallia sp. API 0066]MCD0453550.1 hexameric tyrosine-coordinated heme protein [Actinocorallia sp. API 0066]